MAVWLTILAMALVTYAVKGPVLLALRGEPPLWLRRWLGYVPIAVFTALILPPLLLRPRGTTMELAFGPGLPAGIVGALVAWRTGNVLLTIGAGLLAYWALRWMGM